MHAQRLHRRRVKKKGPSVYKEPSISSEDDIEDADKVKSDNDSDERKSEDSQDGKNSDDIVEDQVESDDSATSKAQEIHVAPVS